MHALLGVVRCLLMISWGMLVAQTAPRQETWESRKPRQQAGVFGWRVWLPADHDGARFHPVVVWLGDRPEGDPAMVALATRGFVAVAPTCTEWSLLFADLRRRCRIEQGGLHAILAGDLSRLLPVVLANREQFQTITVCGHSASDDRAALRRLPARRVSTIEDSDPEQLAAHLQKLHAERTLPGVSGEVAKVLDDFHDAAAVGDEKRYFAILPDDALFLGTDGTERWTGVEFKKFAMPYFERDSAWTYVCLRRHVDVDAGGQFAWFDETFDNEAYGECRGSGVMQKRDGAWVLRQYHLTVPVPNDVTRPVAERIRAFQDEVPFARTTIVFVRHAEKAGPEADELSDAGKRRAETMAQVLRDFAFDAIYTSGLKRTEDTVAPLAAARSMRTRIEPKAKAMVETLRRDFEGKTVLVCGHSNTIPEMLRLLGVSKEVTIGDGEFDRLIVVTLTPDGPQLLTLRY